MGAEADIGLGDQLIATGLARGAKARGKRIAFGDGRRILWDGNSGMIFRGNPNIAPPGSERDSDLEWIRYYKGKRGYNEQARTGSHWIWNLKWRCIPGEMFFSDDEKRIGQRYGRGFVLIEPNVEGWKSNSPNKDWGFDRYQSVADLLTQSGFRVCQFQYAKTGRTLVGADRIATQNFRDALAILSCAALYVGPEGGLHHGAAAVSVPGVVIFGGFIPPSVTGYDTHTNITGSDTACGNFNTCPHCRDALTAISVNTVAEAAFQHLKAA